MSRLLTIFLSITLLGNAGAAVSGLYTYTVNADNVSVTITDYPTTATGAIEIPATIDGRSVTSIGSSAFRYCSSLTSITIPNTVTSIESSAFRDCSSLTSITIPNSVTTISLGYAFSGCTGLTSIVVSTSNPNYSSTGPMLLNKNGTELIAVPSASGDFTIPNSVTSIGQRSFSYCTGLTSVTIPDSVTSIEPRAFLSCTGLTSIIIPDSVTSIGIQVFQSCTGLTSITIPNTVTSIESSAFRDCSSLTSIIIPDSVTSIGGNAFYQCTGLTSIIIPDSVTSIGGSAFRYCTNLESIRFQSMAAPTIGQDAFSQISSDAIITYRHGATGYLTGYSGVPTQEAAAGEFGLYTYEINTDGVSVTITYYSVNATGALVIPDSVDGRSVTSIGERAFWNCTGLTSITIPDSVTSIGSSAFYQCTGLTSIIIPDSVTSIGNYAFQNCSSLISISIGNSVTSIGTYAFSGCTGLTSIIIPDSVTSIGNSAFQSCTGLTSITIPDSVTSIGDQAFAGCTGLTSATIGNSVTSIGSNAFNNCSSLRSIIIPDISANYIASLPDVTFIFVNTLVDALKNDPDFIAAVAQAMLAAENNSGFATKEELPLVEQAGIDQVLADPASYELATSAEVASSFTAGQDDVLSDPASYDLYDEASIMEVNVATPLLSMTNVENQAEIEFAIESSDDLQTWTVNERILRTVEGQGDKYFVRVTAGAPYINPDVLVYAHPTLGDILTNAEGYVLYGFTFNSAGQDPAYTGSSWNFVAATATPEPDAGVTATLAGATFGNVSGGPWLTVNGLPAYTYPLDTAPYQANGHGSGDVWFTLNPDGSLNTP